MGGERKKYISEVKLSKKKKNHGKSSLISGYWLIFLGSVAN